MSYDEEPLVQAAPAALHGGRTASPLGEPMATASLSPTGAAVPPSAAAVAATEQAAAEQAAAAERERAQGTLRAIEGMLRDIGAPAPGAYGGASRVARRLGGAASLATGAQRDCLSTERRKTKATTTEYKRVTPSPGLAPGMSMAGRDHPEKRYFGKAFPFPVVSLGRGYLPKGFAEEAVGRGVGFSRAPREPPKPSNAWSPGPNAYPQPNATFGKMTLSKFNNGPGASWGRAARPVGGAVDSGPADGLSSMRAARPVADSLPGPGAYIEDILNLPTPMAVRGPSPVIAGKLKAGKTFISRAHSADILGRDSPGPGSYNPGLDPSKRASPAIGFGTATRGRPATPSADSGLPPRPAKGGAAAAGSALAMDRSTPGPSSYYPGDSCAKMEGPGRSAVFASGKRELVLGERSCGPDAMPIPKYTQVDRDVPAALVGRKPPGEGGVSDRFRSKEFFGYALSGTEKGAASPGPGVYGAPVSNQWGNPAKGVSFAGRSTAYVGRGLETPGLGGPGPKYNLAHERSILQEVERRLHRRTEDQPIGSPPRAGRASPKN